MAKRKSLIDFEKRWKTGAGQGEGPSYKPWLTVQSFPSLGRSHRVKGWKTFRKHQLLSDLELQYFYVLEWSKAVVDIREQYPLWPRETTKTVADQLGLKHPIIPGTTELSVMTTDFLITIQDQGQSREIARTTKYVKELEKPRVIEKLEIERLWWEAKGVDWGIVTENELPQNLIRNIKNLHDLKTLDGFPQLQQDHHELVQHLTTAVQKSTRSLASIASRCDAEMGLSSGSCLALAKHLIVNRRWVIDLESEFRPTQRLELLDVRLEV